MNQDLEHLRLLSIFHYVVAGVTALFACFPVIHLVVGLAMLFGWFAIGSHGPHNDPAASRSVALLFVVIASMIILIGWAFAICIFLAGRFLRSRRHYMFCLVMAALLCMMAPMGTVLGVFTIIVLMQPSVKPLFEQQTGPPCSG